MEHVFKLKATVHQFDALDQTIVDLHAEGEMNRAGTAALLADVFKALRINPDSVLDMAVIAVALEKCSDE